MLLFQASPDSSCNFTKTVDATITKMQIVRSISGLSACSECGEVPVVGKEFCEHKVDKMVAKMQVVARPPRILPMPRYPILLIFLGLVAGGSFVGGLYYIAASCPYDRRLRYDTVLRLEFNVDNFLWNEVSQYLALMKPEGSAWIVTGLSIALIPFLIYMHWGRTDEHTKFSVDAVVERLRLEGDPKRRKIKMLKWAVFMLHYCHYFFGLPAVICVILVAWFPLNNVGDDPNVLYGEQIAWDADREEYFIDVTFPAYSNGMRNLLDYSGSLYHTFFAVSAFALLTCYAVAHAVGFWIDACIDEYTTRHLQLEFYTQFPEVAKQTGYQPKTRKKTIKKTNFPSFRRQKNEDDDLGKITVLHWPSGWSWFLFFMAFGDLVLVGFTAYDMAGAEHSFGGTSPCEWIFVTWIAMHIALMPFALWGMTERDKMKKRAFAKNRAQAALSLSEKARSSTDSEELIELRRKSEFLNKESDVQIHAGVSRHSNVSGQRSASSNLSSPAMTSWAKPATSTCSDGIFLNSPTLQSDVQKALFL